MTRTIAKGRDALETLAARFPQLYVAPALDAQDAHRVASRRGIAPDNANLSHFITSPADELLEVATPAGPVEVLFLKERADFETFLQIVSHKSQPADIAPTVGAITYRGLADWSKVAKAQEEYLASGGTDWSAEFVRLAKETDAFRSDLVLISEGPYSNLPTEQTPYGCDEWLNISRAIRLHHECAHVVCRRVMPEEVQPVFDEITADMVGLICATGRYDVELASRFLGVTTEGFSGGRLSEYLNDEQLLHTDEVARQVFAVVKEIRTMAQDDELAHPFDFLLELKRHPLLDY